MIAQRQSRVGHERALGLKCGLLQSIEHGNTRGHSVRLNGAWGGKVEGVAGAGRELEGHEVCLHEVVSAVEST